MERSSPAAATTVLVVDDQPENIELLDAILTDVGYRVTTARDGVEALATIAAQPPDAILLDIMMPRLDGFAVCARLKRERRTWHIPVVMVTALADVVSKVRGLEAGADDFLSKPFDRPELLLRLRSLVRIHRLRDELDTTETIILSMVRALEQQQPHTRDHSLRVAALAGAVGRRLQLQPAELETIVWGALLHDIGKLGVPDEVLVTPAAERSPEARHLYEQHPAHGQRILEPLVSLRRALAVVRHHHERLDGSGYPDGLAGPALPLAAEIVAAANLCDRYRTEDGGLAVWSTKNDGAAVWSQRLRADAAAGHFHPDVIEEVVCAALELPATLPAYDELLPPPQPALGGSILIGDDTPANLEVYEDILGAQDYDIRSVSDGEAVLAAVAERKPDLVLLDVRMPRLTGDQVCRALKTNPEYAYLPVILVTAHEDPLARRSGLESGADEFLISPVNRQELVARVRSLLRLRSYHRDLERHESVILSLAGTLEAKDPYTRGHSARVGDLGARLVRELGLPPSAAEEMRVAGLLHDIGKIQTPQRLLNKPGPLTEQEHDEVRTHPIRGCEICAGLRSVEPILPYIRHHHERWDGQGYPDGLAGEAIPLGARVLAVADAFDALTSERSYRKPATPERALTILTSEATAGRWDPQVLEALDRLLHPGRVARP